MFFMQFSYSNCCKFRIFQDHLTRKLLTWNMKLPVLRNKNPYDKNKFSKCLLPLYFQNVCSPSPPPPNLFIIIFCQYFIIWQSSEVKGVYVQEKVTSCSCFFENYAVSCYVLFLLVFINYIQRKNTYLKSNFGLFICIHILKGDS